MKWLSMSTTDKLINNLITEIGKPNPSTQLSAPPSPIFISKQIVNPHSPKSSQMLTPPRSPGGDKFLGRTFSPKTSGSMFDLKSEPKDSFHDSDPDFSYSKDRSRGGDNTVETTRKELPFNEKFSRTDGAALAKAFK